MFHVEIFKHNSQSIEYNDPLKIAQEDETDAAFKINLEVKH